jgi:uncharacterized delta-60 repeat protein
VSRKLRPAATLAAGLLVLAGAIAGPASAAPGDPDPAFGSGGIATTTVPGSGVNGLSLTGTTGGRLVLAGELPGADAPAFVARREADGSASPGFGTGGVADFAVGGFAGVAGTATLPDGRIYVVGESKADGDTTPGLFLARRKADGTNDHFQNATGVRIDRVKVGGSPTYAAGVAVTPDNGAVIIGSSISTGQMVIARFNESGVAQTSFGGGGDGLIVFNPPADKVFSPQAIAVGPDGRITFAGALQNADSDSQILVGRLNADGTPDTTFGTGGSTVFGGEWASAQDVAITPQGTVLGIETYANGRRALGAMRLLADGTPDPAFAGGAVATVNAPGAGHASAVAAGVQADGSVLVGGYVIGSNRWLAARFTPAGAPDAGFGAGGLAGIGVGTSESASNDLLVSGDRVTLAGHANGGSGATVTLARLDASASGGGGGGGTPSGGGDAGTSAITDPVTPVTIAPANTVTVGSTVFTLTRSTQRTVKVPKIGTAFHYSSGSAIIQSAIPYVNINYEFTKSACTKASDQGQILEMSPAGGTEVVVDAQHPLKLTLGICLQDKKYEATCSAKNINKLLGKGKTHVEETTAIWEELERCKVDYDVKFTKKPAEPKVVEISNPKPAGGGSTPTRKPVEQTISCSTRADQQDFRLAWSEGASQGASFSFHASSPKIGWTIPAGVKSFIRVSAFAPTAPVSPIQATVTMDTDAVGSAKLSPMVLKRDSVNADGQKIIMLNPQRAGDIKVCATLQTAGGEGGGRIASATATIRVVDAPKVGDVWPTVGGRTLKVTKTGTTVASAASAGPVARTANVWDDAVGWLKSVFGGQSPAVNQATSGGGSAEAQAQKAFKSGVSVGQVAMGGALGALPDLGPLKTGPLTIVTNGQVGQGTGTVVTAAKDGTAVGIGANGVVAAGGGNVIAAGGGNVIAAGGGNVIAAGGGNVIAAGGGNVIAAGGGNVVAAGGLN